MRQEDGCDDGQSRIHSIPNLFVREVLLGVFKTIHRRSGSGGGDPDEKVDLQTCGKEMTERGHGVRKARATEGPRDLGTETRRLGFALH